MSYFTPHTILPHFPRKSIALSISFVYPLYDRHLDLIMNGTADPKELKKFSDIADHWWNEEGKFSLLHKINPLRTTHILNTIHAQQCIDLSMLSCIDVGCGGGILTESLAKLGMNCTGIDAVKKNIDVAQFHADEHLKKTHSNISLQYICTTVEQHVSTEVKYDIVIAMEIIEHVNNVDLFVASLADLLKTGGLLFVSTINRTFKSLFLAKFFAEYVLNWLPRGTHNWKKFMKPAEVADLLRANALDIIDITGMIYNLSDKDWNLSKKDISMNYIITAESRY